LISHIWLQSCKGPVVLRVPLFRWTQYLTEKITFSHKDYAPQDTLKELLDKTIETQNQKERNAGDFER